MSQALLATKTLIRSQVNAIPDTIEAIDQGFQHEGEWALAIDQLATNTLTYIQAADKLGTPQVMETMRRLPHQLLPWLQQDITRGAVDAMCRGLATAVYLSATEGWQAGRPLRDNVGISSSLPMRIKDMQSRLQDCLRESRRIARKGKRKALIPLAEELLNCFDRLPQLCSDAAAAPSPAQIMPDSPGLIATALAKQLSLLIAALPFLHVRLTEKRLINGTMGIAERRQKLSRIDGPPGRALLFLPPFHQADNVAVSGMVAESDWIEAPDFSYGWARLSSGIVLILPYKRFRTRGVLPGSTIWAAGRIKPDFAHFGRVMEVEAEGPGSHDDEVWLDWLATELRGAFDLFPGSLRLWWEMPDPEQKLSSRDITAHLPEKEIQL